MYPGDDIRDLSRKPRSVESVFWRSFAYARQKGYAEEFIAGYERMTTPLFRSLAAEARKKLEKDCAIQAAILNSLHLVE
jgi:hypothetical protein